MNKVTTVTKISLRGVMFALPFFNQVVHYVIIISPANMSKNEQLTI